MQAEYERFKLDAAAIYLPRLPQQRIIVYNFNIPIEQAQTAATLDTVGQQVVTDLPLGAAGTISPPYFQISAVYTLVHRATNEERLWQGSFNPRARDLSQVTAFRPFDHQTFVNYCVTNCERERVRNKLTAVVDGRNSMWTLQDILSVIVSVQATVGHQHMIFQHHPELVHHGGAQQSRNVFRIYYD